MSLIKTVLADSFTILARNFTLLYALFLFYLLTALLLPAEGKPTLDPSWLMLFGILFLITMAFMAGWCRMIGQACRNLFLLKDKDAPDEPTATISQALGLLKYFFPGIGQHFVSFVLGGLINLTVAGIIAWVVQDVVSGMPQVMEVLTRAFEAPPAERQALLNKLVLSQPERISSFLLVIMAGLLAYGIFSLLTMFWPGWVILYEKNVFKAYGLSIRQFFVDPLRVAGIVLLLLAGHLLLMVLLSTQVMILQILGQFGAMLLEIYTLILTFNYLLHRHGAPADPPLTEAPAENPD